MLYIQRYRSPLGEILMAADDAGLVGLWFAGQKHFAPGLTQAQEQEDRRRRTRAVAPFPKEKNNVWKERQSRPRTQP